MGWTMNTAANCSDWVGRVIDGRFALLQWLGGSGRGGVFLTELQGDGSQKAALKLIPADAVDAEAHIAGWAATTTLSHPHLARVFRTGRCQIDNAELLYAVTEYAEEVLSEIIPERPLTPTEAREMLGPVLDALSYLHRKGFVHGHLKPSNIMVVNDQLKISGEGLHVEGEAGKHFMAPSIYDAPESATGPISAAADVWSLGITLVESLTQHPPVWDRVTKTEPAVPESISQPFAGIARGCLRLNPARRCTLSEIKARLEPAQALSQSPSRMSVPPEPASKTSRTAPTKLRRTTLIAAMLVLFAVIAALYVRSRHVESSMPSGTQPLVMKIPAPAPQSPSPGSLTSKGAAVKGAVAQRVLPDVPLSASRTIRGTVKVGVRVTVDPSGNVSNATFNTPGASRYFANLALQAARDWRFKPALVDGQAVSSVWILQFRFSQSSTEVSPIEASP